MNLLQITKLQENVVPHLSGPSSAMHEWLKPESSSLVSFPITQDL